MLVLAHRIRLDLNDVQETWFERCAGAARFVWNWGLARWQEMREANAKPNWRKLNAELNARKRTDLGWISAIPWKVANTALEDLGGAFQHFFRRVKAGEKPGYPNFKKKGRSKPSFSIEGRALGLDGKRLRIPKLGWVRMCEALRLPGRVLSVRFTKCAGHWYASFQVEVDESRWSPRRCETQAAVGVDLGVVDLAVLPDGERIEAPRVLRAMEPRLRCLGRQLSRRKRGGANWRKTVARLQSLHERIANVRAAVTHDLTARLVRDYRYVGIEHLSVAGMARGRLAKSVMDAALAEVRRQLEYKGQLAGCTVVVAGRWFPSSKRCSSCGHVVEVLPLSVRHWTCPKCNYEHDRDVNAARNLQQLAEAHSVTACGEGSAGVIHDAKLPSSKQEPGICCVH